MVIVLTAEELMKKKGIFKQELDAQTTKSNELWQKSTEKLSEIMKHYGELPKGLRPHINKIFPAAAVYLTVKEELGDKAAFSVIPPSMSVQSLQAP